MHTPEQAKSLWCPMARVAQIGETDTQATYNRTLSRQLMPMKVSVVQHPDNFELGEAPAPEQHTELVLKLFPAVSQSAMCLGDKCAMWRWDAQYGPKEWGDELPDRKGYCGLAGRPEVAA